LYIICEVSRASKSVCKSNSKMPSDKRKAASQKAAEDPFKSPSPGGSKKHAATQPPSVHISSDSDDSSSAAKTPKKAKRSGVATHRNKALWTHFQLDPDVSKEEQTKNTKVCSDW
jgi:hypothetical protein